MMARYAIGLNPVVKLPGRLNRLWLRSGTMSDSYHKTVTSNGIGLGAGLPLNHQDDDHIQETLLGGEEENDLNTNFNSWNDDDDDNSPLYRCKDPEIQEELPEIHINSNSNLKSSGSDNATSKINPLGWTMLAIFCLSLAFFCRYVGTHYFKAATKIHVQMPTNSSFAVAIKPIFYFDLGGTLCMCEKVWNVQNYWSKVLSGFAFNFAHVVGTIEFYILIGDWKVILISVFINEMIEELWLTSGYWGFTFDPPFDQEARYDSLIRDTSCCMMGIHLAITYARIFRIEPLIKFPIKWGLPASNPHSVKRFLKFIIQGFSMWQVTLIFSADKGPWNFNANNIFLIVCYTIAIMTFCYWNLDDWPHLRHRHIIAWHIGWAFCVGYVFAFAIYPVFQSAMYLILCVEASLSMILCALDLWIILKPSFFEKHLFTPRGKPTKAISLKQVLLAVDSLDMTGQRTTTEHQLLAAIQNISKSTHSTESDFSKVKFKMLLTFVSRTIVIIICAQQPMLWHGIQYKRHWCGNPNVGWFNGCP